MRARVCAGLLAFLVLAACKSETAKPSVETSLSVEIIVPPELLTADAGIIHLEGPTNRTMAGLPSETQTADNIQAGAYTVSFEGFVGGTAGQVVSFGQTAVSVAAGQENRVTVTLSSFLPTGLDVPSTVLVGQPATVSFDSVRWATSYVVELADDDKFTKSASQEVTALSAPVTVDSCGSYFVRVSARDRFGATGIPSSSAQISAMTSLSVEITAPPELMTADAGIIHLEGPTNRTMAGLLGETQSADSIQPGTYTVSFEGFVGGTAGQVVSFGQTAVTVVAGQENRVTVTLSSFVPTGLDVPSTVVVGEPATVSFDSVRWAAGYVVELADDDQFTDAMSQEVTAPSAPITVDTCGSYYVRVSARDRFGATGIPSSSAQITVVEADTTTPSVETSLSIEITSPPELTTADAGIIHLEGPTNRTMAGLPGETQSADSIQAGTYTVSFEGFVGDTAGQVVSFGQTTVTVVAGQENRVAVTLSSFVPTGLDVPSTVVVGEPATVSFDSVAWAVSFVVELADDDQFTNAASQEVTAPSATITIGARGSYYVRVSARDRFGAPGIPSSPAQITAVVTSLSVEITAPPELTTADAGIVHLEGPTNRTMAVLPGETQTADSIQAGTYTVSFEGFVGGTAGQVVSYGETAATVVAGQENRVTIALSSFQPAGLDVPSLVGAGRPATVSFDTVRWAASYVVAVAHSDQFTNATSQEVTNPPATITIDTTGTYYVRVAARDRFGATGIPSSSVQVSVVKMADGADVEALISGAYKTWFSGAYDYSGPGMFLSNQSFQHASPWTNAAMEFYGRIPRQPIINDEADSYYGNFTRVWYYSYRALAAVSRGLRSLQDSIIADELGANSVLRDQAYGYFVLGVAHASLAVLYDQAFVVDETTDVTQPQTVQPYAEVMTAAMGYFDKTIQLCGQSSFTLPYSWLSTPNMDNTMLAQIAHSEKARYLAAVARTPVERQAVDWNAVISNVDAGITDTWAQSMDDSYGWGNTALYYGSLAGWSETPYWIYGMADQSGNYQRWLGQPLSSKLPNPSDGDIVIITPDTRFPQGADIATQRNSAGFFTNGDTAIATPSDIGGVWAHPERGQWRWSWYRMEWPVRGYDATRTGEVPEIPMDEMNLLKAEGLYYQGDLAGAAGIINQTRTANGLNATDASGTNTSCVPKLPDSSCGDLFEMLKWEKRMQIQWQGLFTAPWWFDSRGWGDLWKDTPLEFPIPCKELQTLQMLPCYTFGGAGGTMSAPISRYHYPGEG